MLFEEMSQSSERGWALTNLQKTLILPFVSPATSSRTWKGQVDSNFQCFQKYSFVQ